MVQQPVCFTAGIHQNVMFAGIDKQCSDTEISHRAVDCSKSKQEKKMQDRVDW